MTFANRKLTREGGAIVSKLYQACGQVLSDEDGFTARCSVPFGTEHSHHDATARGAVALGTALRETRPVAFDEDGNEIVAA